MEDYTSGGKEGAGSSKAMKSRQSVPSSGKVLVCMSFIHLVAQNGSASACSISARMILFRK
jgi:hypothetical protein